MKEIAFGLVASLAVGSGVYFAMGSGGYEMTAAQARAKLMNANVNVENGPFGSADGDSAVTVTSPSADQVQWTVTAGGLTTKKCTATLTPIGDQEVQVKPLCKSLLFNDMGQGAVLAEMAQADITEFVDAALTGRPYNYKRKYEAGTASVAKNMGSIMSDGLKVKRQIEEMEFNDTAEYEPEAAPNQDDIIGEVESPADYSVDATE